MDSIRAAGPLSISIRNIGNINSSVENANVSAPQDNFARTSCDDSFQSMNLLRDFSISAEVRNAIEHTPDIPPATIPPAPSIAPASDIEPVSLPSAPSIEAVSIAPSPAVESAPPIPASIALDDVPFLFASPPGNSAQEAELSSSSSSVPSPNPSPGVSSTTPIVIQDDGGLDVADVGETCCNSISMSTSYMVEAGEVAGLSAAAGAMVGAIGGSICSLGYAAAGAAMIHDGIKEGDPEGIIGGTGNIFDSISNGAAVAEIATAGAEIGSVGATIGSIAGKIATPFGLASSAVDFGLGTKEVIEGVKNRDKTAIASGALGMAFGVATAASCFIGGPSILIASGAILLAKCGVAIKQVHDARAQARAQAQTNIQPQPSTSQSSATPVQHQLSSSQNNSANSGP